MGVDIRDIISLRDIELSQLHGKVLSVDALNALYQFLAIIRQRDGEVLKDSAGRTTSHLSGLFYRTINLVESGIRPVYVFDGKPPDLKIETLHKRKVVREEAKKRAIRAKVEGREADYAKYVQQDLVFSRDMLSESRKLLDLMGIPYVDAPSEAEAQASHMSAQDARVYAIASQDYDSLLFGAPRLIRNVTITGRRKLPGKNAYRDIVPEMAELSDVLGALGITSRQLIEIGLLIGTDYNDGVKGIGPKKALEVVRADAFGDYGIDESLIKMFTEPEVTDDYDFSFGAPDGEGVKSFLCEEHDFSSLRVERALERLNLAIDNVLRQNTLDQWF